MINVFFFFQSKLCRPTFRTRCSFKLWELLQKTLGYHLQPLYQTIIDIYDVHTYMNMDIYIYIKI